MNLTKGLIAHEASVRIILFLGVFILIAIWQYLSPKRKLTKSLIKRWRHNLALVVLNTFILRLLLPAASVNVAAFGNQYHLGLLYYAKLPSLINIVLSIVLLDLVIYLQHRLFHIVPFLWRFHKVHHADLDYDISTGLRFHTIEIILSTLIKCAAILAIGASAVTVILFEIILNALAIFNHGNISLPTKIDYYLRWFIVTPDMHRIHHSIEEKEMNHNFGFNLSCWDRFFHSYQQLPKLGQLGMEIGLKNIRNSKKTNSLFGMLTMPFIK